MNVHLLLLVVYSVGLIAVGLWIGRRVRTSRDFFVAGRQLGAPLLGATVLAANIGAGTTVGAAGLAYQDGLSAWWWNGSVAIGSVFLACWIGPKIWTIAARHDLLTTGDYLEFRYGPAVRGVVASLVWLGSLSILAGQLIAGAAVLTVVADIPRWAGTIASALVMTVYFMAGGLLGSAWVNAVQLVVLLGGLALAVPVVVSNAGGLGAIVQSPAVPSTFSDLFYSAGAGSGLALLARLGPAFVVSPGLIQKVYGASSARAVRLGIGVQAGIIALFGFIPAILGMAARVVNPGIESPNLVLPTVLAEQLPTSLAALGLAAIYSAEVSTCDAILFMLATSLSRDLYKRFVRPDATDSQVLGVARLSAVTGAIGGVILALVLPTVTAALGIFYALLSASLLVPVVGGLYSRRATSSDALRAIAAGVLTLLAVQFATDGRGVGWIEPTLAGLVAATFAFVVGMMWRTRTARG